METTIVYVYMFIYFLAYIGIKEKQSGNYYSIYIYIYISWVM